VVVVGSSSSSSSSSSSHGELTTYLDFHIVDEGVRVDITSKLNLLVT